MIQFSQFFKNRSPVAQSVEHVAVHEAQSAECKTRCAAREHEEGDAIGR